MEFLKNAKQKNHKQQNSSNLVNMVMQLKLINRVSTFWKML